MNEVQSVKRATAILSLLGEHPRGMTLADVATALDIPSASALRILKTLLSDEYVIYSEHSTRYFLGNAIYALNGNVSLADLRAVAEPAIHDLARDLSETIFVAKFVGDKVICVLLAEGQRDVRLFVNLGQKMPLHSAASARCLLAGLGDAEVLQLVTQEMIDSFYTPMVQNQEELLKRLDVVRNRGYEVSAGELNDHAWAVAAPIIASNGQQIACITATTPSISEPDPKYQELLTQHVIACARAVSSKLGAFQFTV